MQSLTDRQKAYIAGVVDGEGTITLRDYKSNSRRSSNGFTVSPIVVVPNTAIALLAWLRNTTHIGTIVPGKVSETRKPLSVWTVPTNQIIEFLRTIRDDLVIKGSQADIVLEFMERKWNSPLTEREIITRIAMVGEIQDLNKRGV